MTYIKPEIDIEKFDLVEAITADQESATGADQIKTNSANGAVVVDESVASDLIVG